jgi:hypothetical protein
VLDEMPRVHKQRLQRNSVLQERRRDDSLQY